MATINQLYMCKPFHYDTSIPVDQHRVYTSRFSPSSSLDHGGVDLTVEKKTPLKHSSSASKSESSAMDPEWLTDSVILAVSCLL